MGRCQQSNPTSIVGQHWNALPTSLNELEFYDHHRRRNSTGIEILIQFALFKQGIGAKDKWRPQKSSCKKGKKNTPIQNQIHGRWNQSFLFSLFSFLFSYLPPLSSSQDNCQWKHTMKLLELCNKGWWRYGEFAICTTFHVTLQTVAVWYAGNKDIAYKYGECYPYEGASMAMWCKSASCYSAHSFPPLQTFSRWECNRI